MLGVLDLDVVVQNAPVDAAEGGLALVVESSGGEVRYILYQ